MARKGRDYVVKIRAENDELKRKLKESRDEFKKFGSGVAGMKMPSMTSLLGAAGIAVGLNELVGAARRVISESIELTKTTQATFKGLELVSEGTLQYRDNLEFLRGASEDYGLELNRLTSSYLKFLAATKDTAVEGEKADKIFQSVAKSSAAIGLSMDETEGVLRALGQMLSKGKVQAEELRGQLGDRLPGAFNIMAKSMGVTTAQLDKMLKNGEVIADKVLPKFAEQLEETFGVTALTRVETLIAAEARRDNAWLEAITNLEKGEGVIARVYKTWIDLQTEVIKAISGGTGTRDNQIDKFVSSWKENQSTIEDIRAFYGDVLDRTSAFAGPDAAIIKDAFKEYEDFLQIQKELGAFMDKNNISNQKTVEGIGEAIGHLNKQKVGLEKLRDEQTQGTEKWKKYDHQIKLVDASFEMLNKQMEEMTDAHNKASKAADEQAENLKKLRKESIEASTAFSKLKSKELSLDMSVVSDQDTTKQLMDQLTEFPKLLAAQAGGFEIKIPAPEVNFTDFKKGLEDWNKFMDQQAQLDAEKINQIRSRYEELAMVYDIAGQSMSDAITGMLDNLQNAISGNGNFLKSSLRLFYELLKQAGYTFINAGVMDFAQGALLQAATAGVPNPESQRRYASGARNVGIGLALGAPAVVGLGLMGRGGGGNKQEAGTANLSNSNIDVTVKMHGEVSGDKILYIVDQANAKRRRGA